MAIGKFKQVLSRARELAGVRESEPEDGCMRVPVIVHAALMLAFPFMATGLVRSALSISLPASLAVVVTALALVSVFLKPCILRLHQRLSWPAEAISVLLVGLAIWALYIRDFSGFPNLDGWDGGTHVLLKDQFATAAPGTYNGQTSYFALAWWIEKVFATDSFHSFSAAFYIGLAAAVAFPVTVVLSVTSDRSGQRRISTIVGYCVGVIGVLSIFWLVWLPLVHYNQAAGFYAHVFGLWPLVMVWAADALLRQQLLRVIALLSGLVFLRYTYALNLADAFAAVGVALLLEGFRGKARIVQALLFVALAIAAYLVLSELRPVFRIWGGMQRFAVDDIVHANVLLAVAAIVYLVLTTVGDRPRRWTASTLLRVLRFPILFALASTAFLPILRSVPGVQKYYITKYPVWPCMLLAFVLVIILVHIAMTFAHRRALRSWTAWLRLGLVAVLLVVVPSVWTKTFAGYRQTFQERLIAHGPPYKYLRPLADTPTTNRIHKILATEEKAFGGYLTTFFPMFSFMNATLGYHTGVQDFFPPLTTIGHCVFWVPRERDIYPLGPAEKINAYRFQLTAAGATCTEDYTVRWKSTPQSLCYRCY